jgi:hypothetical protein|tara:strand:+ start:22581 stop:22799 length:219 start_codon:yes stop_codon:yes gene_type:complete
MKRSDDWISELHYKEFVKPKFGHKDFYWEGGKMVMTEEYHKKRGSCCGSGCKHCPFTPQHIKMNKNLRKDNS